MTNAINETDKVMEILNNSEVARQMLNKFNVLVSKSILGEEEIADLRKTHMTLIIASVPEAMSAMAEEVYNGIHAS